MKNRTICKSAVAGVLALGLMTGGASAFANEKEKMEMMDQSGMEKCYGIAKAGMNDCKSGLHGCKGLAKGNGEKGSFLLVPQGTCNKIVGGSTEKG
ncbi:MAG: signal peptidase [Nitrospinae bacterium CG11_big_fil_rev_8_21_14_0_20_56_8]|nr:MAG: signal peptidase [Nitrospinae bacterium CG11_big_fil_rev_8_21_14_0_20_56_8]